jgi:hypothetical protein
MPRALCSDPADQRRNAALGGGILERRMPAIPAFGRKIAALQVARGAPLIFCDIVRVGPLAVFLDHHRSFLR